MKKLLITTLLGLSSCATIIEGGSSKVDVSTAPYTTGTACQLNNGLGSWSETAPGSTKVLRSKTDLNIACNNPSTGASGSKVVESDMEPWFLGNIVLGGIIGGVVDASTGDMWKYPSDVTVNMNAPVLSAPVPVPAPPAQAQPQTNAVPMMVPQAAPQNAPVTSMTPVYSSPSYPTGRQ